MPSNHSSGSRDGLPTNPLSNRSKIGPPSSYSSRSKPSEWSSSSQPPRSKRLPASLTGGTRIPEVLGSGLSRDPDRARYRKQSDELSSTSESSGGSSFLDWMRGSKDEYASSLTSWEDDDKSQATESKSSRKGGVEGPRRSREDEEIKPTEGDGYSIWGRVATVAGSLTVDLGKAWATNMPTYNGEVTPPDEESHLTRAMKAYHLDKARDPSDLPTWLFDEHERRSVGQPRYSDRRREDDTEYEAADQPDSERSRSQGFRGTATNVYTRTERTPASNRFAEDAPSRSKATNRLKELRDAKRSAHAIPNRYEQPVQTGRGEDSRSSAEADRRRVGLPSGPSLSGGRSRKF